MYKPFRHLSSIFWKRRPIQLTFFVTSECNSSCPFCFYLRRKDKVAGARPELTLDEIEKISRTMGSLLWILFSGGEIYLRKDIADISRAFYDNCKPAILTYPTNGLLPKVIRKRTEEILEHCRNSVVVVKLSLDGLYSEHDNLRGVKGNFDKVIETYNELSGLASEYPNLELGVNTVFCSENQDKIKDVISFVGTLPKISTHTVSLARGNLEDERFKDVDLSKYREVTDFMASGSMPTYSFRGARLKAAQDILQRQLIYQTVKARKRLIPCYAGRLNVVIDETGDVYPCELSNLKIGSLGDYEYDFPRLFNSAEGKAVRKEIAMSNCYCSHECYFATNIFFNPRLYPGLMSEYLRLISARKFSRSTGP